MSAKRTRPTDSMARSPCAVASHKRSWTLLAVVVVSGSGLPFGIRVTASTCLQILAPRASGLQYWRRSGPVPREAGIGSGCKSSLQCLRLVPHSHCDWDSRTCACEPYHVQVNESTCLPASLLGFGCSVDEQCTLKVPNSRCSSSGVCECEQNFVSYRRDKCLPRKLLVTA